MQNRQKGGEDVLPVWLLTCVVCTDQVIWSHSRCWTRDVWGGWKNNKVFWIWRKGEMHQLYAAGHQRALGHNRGHFIMCYLPYGASKRALFTKGGLIVLPSPSPNLCNSPLIIRGIMSLGKALRAWGLCTKTKTSEPCCHCQILNLCKCASVQK